VSLSTSIFKVNRNEKLVMSSKDL